MLLDLEKEQQLAFNRLKKAYSDCKKLKVNLINQYGTLVAYNGKLIIDFADDEIKPHGHCVPYLDVMEKFIGCSNYIDKIDVGRADDSEIWMMGLSDKGLEIYESED
jgi:hypothetical protein